MTSTLNNAIDMTGRIALVTGGGTGIGLMIATGFAENGAKVYVAGRRLDVLKKAAEQKFGGNGGLVPLELDVTDKKSILNAVDIISKNDGKLDVLVNNAGVVGPYAPFVSDLSAPEAQSAEVYGKVLFNSQSFEEWAKLEDINLAPIFFMTTAFLGLLEASVKGGVEDATASVINITSAVTHFDISHGVYAYVAIKTAATRLGRSMAQDFALKGFPVRVNTVAPGLFPSQLGGSRESANEEAKQKRGAILPTPAMRAGRGSEIAGIAIYLASPAAAYINGQDIAVDGGVSLVNP